jgi:predicted lactoylglutathione lyase
MAEPRPRLMFVNLAVRDLQKSMDFFSALGFGFNPQFTDENAACMIVSDAAFVMLLTQPFFRTFTRREPCNTRVHTEGLFAISCGSRQEVDEMVTKAIGAGGTQAMDPQDHGFMYTRSFYDLDEHHWEVFWMDPKTVQ